MIFVFIINGNEQTWMNILPLNKERPTVDLIILLFWSSIEACPRVKTFNLASSSVWELTWLFHNCLLELHWPIITLPQCRSEPLSSSRCWLEIPGLYSLLSESLCTFPRPAFSLVTGLDTGLWLVNTLNNTFHTRCCRRGLTPRWPCRGAGATSSQGSLSASDHRAVI